MSTRNAGNHQKRIGSDEPGRDNGKIARDSTGAVKSSAPKDAEERGFEDEFGDDVIEEVVVDAEEDEATPEDMILDDEAPEMEEEKTPQNRMYRQGIDEVDGDAVMEYDNSAYIMLHQMQVEYPFLSFDFIGDNLGGHRVKFPKTAFLLGGTQASDAQSNKIQICKLKSMYRTQKDRLGDQDMSDSDDSDSDDENLDEDATLDFRSINHQGAVNRVRCMQQHSHIAATWSDQGIVSIWDLKKQLVSLGAMSDTEQNDSAGILSADTKPIFTFRGHPVEGYAVDWSPVAAGRLATGDCEKNIYIWSISTSGQCSVKDKPLIGHTDSVEDLQWSRNEASILASCGVDRSIRIWDVRQDGRAVSCVSDAHCQDINVMSWNPLVSHVIASGGDDGMIKAWDLRMFKPARGSSKAPEPVGLFDWHKAPITSVEWHPQDGSVLVAAGANNQVSIWDLSLESDIERVGSKIHSDIIGWNGEKVDVPPQLLFLHEGQQEIKEVHFHRQIPGFIGSTAADGFHAFIPEPLDPKTIKT